MKLLKKLVILSGKGYEKGTFTVEKNAVSVSGRANLHNLRNLSSQQYILVIICTGSVYFIEMGTKGTSTKTFLLPYEADISSLHCAVCVGQTLALYGTTENKKMWEGNIIDILRRRSLESKKDNAEKPKQTDTQAEINYSNREKNIKDYFLNIVTDYNDDAVAEINYFDGFSARQKAPSNIRPKLTEKYYDRLLKADSTFVKNVSDSDKEPSQNNISEDTPIAAQNDVSEDTTTAAQNDTLEDTTTAITQNDTLEDITTAVTQNDISEDTTVATQNDTLKDTTIAAQNDTLKDTTIAAQNDISEDITTAAEQNDIPYENTSVTAQNVPHENINVTAQNNMPHEDSNVTEGHSSKSYTYPKKTRFKEYYDRLKEKYGYNKNIFGDYKKSMEADENANMKNLREEQVSFTGSNTSANKLNQINECSANEVDNNESSLNAAKQTYQPNRADNNESSLNAAKQIYQPNRADNEKTYQSDKTHEEILKPIIEAASTLSIKKVPPLESSFSRIRLGTFYEQIKDQIDIIFKTYAKSEELEALIPDSKWVRVDYNGDGKYYVIGVIGKPDYICYGVPAVYTPLPPAELADYCQWLPLDITNPAQNGYWLLFQDAVSGESIKNEII